MSTVRVKKKFKVYDEKKIQDFIAQAEKVGGKLILVLDGEKTDDGSTCSVIVELPSSVGELDQVRGFISDSEVVE